MDRDTSAGGARNDRAPFTTCYSANMPWPKRVGATFALFLSITAALAVLRFQLYTSPGVRLGWNSDTAIYGLIARAMARDHRPVFFFWEEDYLGTLTSFCTLVGAAFAGGITPLALRIGATLQVAASLTLLWYALRSAWGAGVATGAGGGGGSRPDNFF